MSANASDAIEKIPTRDVHEGWCKVRLPLGASKRKCV